MKHELVLITRYSNRKSSYLHLLGFAIMGKMIASVDRYWVCLPDISDGEKEDICYQFINMTKIATSLDETSYRCDYPGIKVFAFGKSVAYFVLIGDDNMEIVTGICHGWLKN